jgi:hypothetical protein
MMANDVHMILFHEHKLDNAAEAITGCGDLGVRDKGDHGRFGSSISRTHPRPPPTHAPSCPISACWGR